MELGSVISTTVETLKSRLVGLIGIWLAFFVLQIVFMLIFFSVVGLGGLAAGAAMGGLDDPSSAGALGLGMGMIGGLFLFYLLYIAIYCAQNLSMAHYASPLVSQDIGESFGVGFRGMLTMLGVFVLFIVAYIAVVIVFGILGAILGAILGEAAALVLGLIAMPAIIYLACRLILIWPVVAVDGIKNPVTAISRTWYLSGGNVLTIFLGMVVYAIAAIIVFGIAIMGFFGVIEGFQQAALAGEGPPMGGIVAMVLVFGLLGLAFGAAGSALFSAMHSKITDTGTENLSETFG